MRMLAVLSLAATSTLLGTSDPALAGRALEEPAGLAKVVKGAPRAELDKLLVDAGLERCKAALKADELLGLECRGVAAAVWVRRKPVITAVDVDARAALFTDLVTATGQVSTWAPLSPPPGLARARFDAHRSLSGALMGLFDDVNAARGIPKADEFAKGKAKELACTAAQRTLDLGVGADASLEERGAAQGVVTSHRCGLDESRLKVEPKPGLALKDSADAANVAASTSSAGAILAYAQTRSLDIARCEKHVDAGGRPKDAAKLEQCACGAIGRWKLPAPKAAVTTKIPVTASVGVNVDVGPAGAITRCALAP